MRFLCPVKNEKIKITAIKKAQRAHAVRLINKFNDLFCGDCAKYIHIMWCDEHLCQGCWPLAFSAPVFLNDFATTNTFLKKQSCKEVSDKTLLTD